MSQELSSIGTLPHNLRQARVHSSSCIPRLLSPENHAALNACFRSRYRYFVQERGWVEPEKCLDTMERDVYDAHVLHLAVFDGDEVLAYLRALPHRGNLGFMVDNEFSVLLSEKERDALPREGSVELSRFVCECKVFQQEKSQPHAVEILLRLLYRTSQEHGFQRFYIVVEEAWLKPFARRFGLQFHILGQPYTFPDGTRTVVATATLNELEEGMKKHNVAKHNWYQNQE